MQSKYKVGLMRVNLLVAASLTAFLATTAQSLPDAFLLGLTSLWLTVTATQIELSHRHLATIPWQLLPGLLLAALLWATPGRHLTWFWAWAILLMLPQPRWILMFNALLAAASWWNLHDRLGLEQWLLAGLLLAGLMLLGLSRSLELQAMRQRIRDRARLVPELPVWSNQRLLHDVRHERHRARHEGGHVELLLLRSPRWQLWPMAEQCCRLLQPYDNAYRLDRRTLGLLLVSRNAAQAEMRRQALLSALTVSVRIRAIALPGLGSLSHERRALARQAHPLEVKEIAHHG
ncbi:hypothetical protein [Halomonas organivorans]|uniref:Uncharacterized protein n=1 Tax=Halomonas organivorans TaxID=257772 RepID=A0A7W5G4G6_9GAMM|nr:hypothetical protein [Halomonas organivorans]MBB3140104.1 hypothetical protein [Halomonas organivorans]